MSVSSFLSSADIFLSFAFTKNVFHCAGAEPAQDFFMHLYILEYGRIKVPHLWDYRH